MRECFNRWDGDQAAFDQEHAHSEERDSEADLGLGQPFQWPADGEKHAAAVFRQTELKTAEQKFSVGGVYIWRIWFQT